MLLLGFLFPTTLLLAGTSYRPATFPVTKPGVAQFATPGAYLSHVGVTPPMYELYPGFVAVGPAYFGPTDLFEQLLW